MGFLNRFSIHHFILLFIFLLGVFIRLYKINDLPYPLNNDEKALGYYSYSLLTNGTDEYGTKFPLYFASIGDYKYPGYIYLSIPFIGLFGLSEFSTRLLSGLLGSLIILLLYKLTLQLFNNRYIALLSAILIAINPWSITFSRTASESNTALFFCTLGIYLMLLFQKSKLSKYLLFSFFAFIISFYTYPSSRIFIPAFLLTYLFLTVTFKHTDKVLLPRQLIIFSILITIISGLSLIPWQSRARASSLSILNNPTQRQSWISTSTEVMGYGDIPRPVVITRAFFNKPISLIKEVAERYLSHYSIQYLFITGDIVPQNSIPNFGLFYSIEIIFLLFGLTYVITHFTNASSLTIASLLASGLPAATSVETPSAVRQLISLPFFIILIALGAYYLFSLATNKIKPLLLVGISGFYLYYFAFLVVNLFQIKPHYRPWTSDQGHREMAQTVWQLKDQYDKVVIPKDPYMDFLFYNQIPVASFLSSSQITPLSQRQWDRVKSIKNIVFNMDVPCPKIGKTNVLYVCTGDQVPRSAHIIKAISYKDNVPAFTLLEFKALELKDQAKESLPPHMGYMEGDGRYPLGILPDSEDRLY